MKFAFNSRFDKFYSYRTARVHASFFIHLDDEEIAELKSYIEKRCNCKFDNHICWTLKDGSCFMYSDRTLFVGNEIIIENW